MENQIKPTVTYVGHKNKVSCTINHYIGDTSTLARNGFVEMTCDPDTIIWCKLYDVQSHQDFRAILSDSKKLELLGIYLDWETALYVHNMQMIVQTYNRAQIDNLEVIYA